MGFGGISPWQLIIILIIVLLIFGTKKLRNLGTDLGGAIRGFKKEVKEEETQGELENAGESEAAVDPSESAKSESGKTEAPKTDT